MTVTKGKGQNSFTKRKTGEFFQWKANGSCSKRESCSFLHSRASGNRETTAEEVMNARVSGLKPVVNNEQRRKGKGQASSSVPTGKGQTDVKSSTSLEASPATRAKIPCLWGVREGGGEGQDVKDRHVIFDILPCVVITSLETDAFMARVACVDMLMVSRNPERSRGKRVLQGAVANLRQKNGPRLCVSKFRSKEVYSAESWANEIGRFGGTHHKILRTHLVRNSNSGEKRAISGPYPKKRRTS